MKNSSLNNSARKNQALPRLLAAGLSLFGSPLLWAHGDLHETIVAVEKDLASKPGDPELIFSLASLYSKHGDFADALALCDRISPDSHPDVHLVRALILARASQTENALAELTTFTRLCPHKAKGWFEISHLLSNQDKPSESAAAQQTGLETPGQHQAEQYLRGASLWEELAQLDRALATTRLGIAAHPHHQGLKEKEAQLLVANGKAEEACEILARLRANHPKLAYRWWQMEAELISPSQPGQAKTCYQNALTHLQSRFQNRKPPLAIRDLQKTLATRIANLPDTP